MAKICPECHSSANLNWVLFPDNTTGVADGRLKMHEINIKAYLSCEYCSETIEVITTGAIVDKLNKSDGIT